MTIHIKKLCVGVNSIQELQQWQNQKLKNQKHIYHPTRNTPKQKQQILNGGSLYWIINGQFSARQKITNLIQESAENITQNHPDKPPKPHCLIILDEKLIPVYPQKHRAFQGWRYLQDQDKPQDISQIKNAQDINGEQLNPELIQQLRNIGIIV